MAWQFSESKPKIFDWIQDQYGIYKVLPEDIDPAIDFLENSSTYGFVLHLKKLDINLKEAQFLLDFFKEKFKVYKYITNLSDRRSKKNTKEIIERHYLKPKHKYTESKTVDQAFGNVTLSLNIKNNVLHNLKCSATAYPDRTFQAAYPFDEFMSVFND